MAHQLKLFDPSLNVTSRLKMAMRQSIRGCAISREEIVDRMKAIARADGLGGGRGSTISVPNLDAWVSETKANIIPVNLLPVFCRVVGDLDPLRVLVSPLGASVVDREELRLLEWAKVEVQAKQLARRRKKIMSELEGLSDE